MSGAKEIRQTFFLRNGKLSVNIDKFNEYGKIDLDMLLERDPEIVDIFKNHALDLRAHLDRELLQKLLNE